ncbi:uncharacterized protein LOC111347144, partial [Stylophora pistillata]|uniref:uncharacterized protein LOC111347144 n=1 Tax=Stylophora pistillata TaxID=50429 RepID=UPI000C044A3D
TPNSRLRKEYQTEIKQQGFNIKVVEKAGIAIKRLLQKSDPFKPRQCGREDCPVCSTGGKGPCDRESVTYEIKCIQCNSVYVGETARSAYTRGKEHTKSLNNKEERSALWKHCAPDKPTITNEDGEVDVDFTVTWSTPQANGSNRNTEYRIEWRKELMVGSVEVRKIENTGKTCFKITGLEYNSKYEVKLFAVNTQGDSEPDIRTFKTKIGGLMNIIVDVARAIFGRRQMAQREMESARTEKILGLIAENYLQTTPPQSSEEHNRFKTYLTEMKVLLTGVSRGSLLITVRCDSLESLERLWEENSCGHLDKMVQDCFVTEKVMKELHLVELKLKTTMDIEEYNACKVYFERDALRALKSSSGRQFSHSSMESGQHPLSSALGTQGKSLQGRSHTPGDNLLMASATPSYPSTKETSNYAQLCRLLVDVGSCVLREIFDRICPPGHLQTVLTDATNRAKLQTLRKKRVLSTSQWGKLYPAVKSSVSSINFESSLLILLLRNIWGLTLPASGRDDLPLVTDTTPAADITRIM